MRTLLRAAATVAVALGLVVYQTEGARASGFHSSPSIVQLTARAHSGSVTVTNTNDAPLRVEIEAFHWDQGAGGQTVLDPTDQLLVFPQLIVIPPGESRQVRLAALAAPTDREQTYQVSITEIPAFSSPATRTAAVTVRMRADIPVFFRPPTERWAGAIAAAKVKNGALAFSVANLGTVHFEAKNLQVAGLGPDMREVFSQNVGTEFVLAGSQRDYRVALPHKACSTLRVLTISLDADAQHLTQTLDIPPGACGP
jgi:P pilus assembly chaperone PapD